jgi:indolepyruvate ferredoxin oxidoreductase alpha subunit
LNDKLGRIEADFETSPLNVQTNRAPRQKNRKYPFGIIAAGVPATTAAELLDEFGVTVPVLKLGTVFPLPQQLVSEFVSRCEQTLVLEEPDAAIEYQIRDRRRVRGRLDGTVPNAGELSPEVLYPILRERLEDAELLPPKTPAPAPAWGELLGTLSLPVRAPRLCPGCGHRSSFYQIRRTFPGAIFTSDIGCYTLGTNLRAVDTCLDMGAGITIAAGLYQAYRLDGKNQSIVATIGDSTFVHSGVPGLANAVHSNARFVLVILDNGTTAMTGFQPTAANGRLADGSPAQRVAISDLVRACGVEFVAEVDPYRHDEFEATLKQAQDFTSRPDGGIAVVIATRPCVLYDRSPIDANPIKVEVTDECDGCKYCLVAFECPALVLNPVTNQVEIDRRTCVDCGECIDACYKGFIVESRPMTIFELATKVGAEQGLAP